ncbi:hypothetical protein FNF27_01880 [Cafeteria roenbergensis]|uniref:CS domain-containing protein n=1 Tax=Cafeteria roenbergensis TaxID=33653 RepID=A0A5A8EGC8_CAFRO|nr:hypothetical protein FNF28_05533 [Cafeteria roenbergensis]KAA0168979.1 hypothetical protein FNF31_00140 [Cafeteria roenbergensis]KAA0176599.1 hypothetical protein FNF27_01880 [Cafeteria roenbergensis]
MPITPELTWEQDATAVRVFIPLKGISRKTVDLYASETFVKVNFPPYLLMLDLHAPIADHDARASYRDGMLVLSLPKQHEGAWPALQAEGLDKAALRDRREASMEKRRNEDEALGKARRQRQQEASDLAFRRQMALENAEREQLEARKAEAKDEAEARVYEALARVQAEAAAGRSARPAAAAAAAATAVTSPDAGEDPGAPEEAPAKPAGAASITAESAASPAAAQSPSKKQPASDAPAIVFLPPPRSNGAPAKVPIRFTERAFPTPLRQSKKAEEDDWMARNKHLIDARRRAVAKDAADAIGEEDASSIQDRDPDWLKAKGDDLLKAGDLAGAANAYGAALQRDPAHLGALGNRAVARLRLGHDTAAALDCTTALSLLPRPPVDPAPALPPVDLALLRKQADAAAALAAEMSTKGKGAPGPAAPSAEASELLAKDPAAALPHYAASLAVQPGFVPALVNRAGAHASLKDLAACERDASAALEALGIGEAETSVAAAVQAWAAAGEMPAFVPAWGSVRLSAWIKTACLRRAAARMRMGRPKDASRDFRKAVELDPLNARIMRDMQQATAAVLVATGAVRESTVEAETASAAGTA